MRNRLFIIAFLALLAAFLLSPTADAADRPNILWLSAEDISAHLGCYGDPHAITPNLDRLASQGIRYTHAYTTAGVCAPNRSGIITGMYQTTLGTHHMRCNAELLEHIKPFPVYLRQAGYYCTNNSKKDYQFRDPRETWDESSGRAHWRNRKEKDQPFFAVFNFTGCHESGIASAGKYKSVTSVLSPDQRQDSAKLTTLPPYYPDTPVTREDWKRNYELITAMDHWAGRLIAQLKEDGLYEDTIIMFWSDHGVGLPRAKRWLYESGTHVPLIVHVPEKWRSRVGKLPGAGDGVGVVTDQLVSSIDFGPTVLNLAGVDVPEHVQGRPFLGEGQATQPRDYVYGARDRMDERYDIIRMVRDKRYRYIRNYEPWKPYYQYMNTPEKGATMQELRRLDEAGELTKGPAKFMADSKPVEELYDVQNDPHEMNNLAGSPEHRKILERMRAAHLKWVLDTRDVGLMPEPEIELREKKLGSRFAILRQPDADDLIDRLRAAANAAIADEADAEDLSRIAGDKDAAVRYWAAIGFGNHPGAARKAGDTLAALLKDSSAVVRVAAARAYCKIEQPDEALPVLIEELESDEQWTRLHAAVVLDEIDALAKPAVPALKNALKNQPNKYIVRVANRALNELLGTNNRVP